MSSALKGGCCARSGGHVAMATVGVKKKKKMVVGGLAVVCGQTRGSEQANIAFRVNMV